MAVQTWNSDADSGTDQLSMTSCRLWYGELNAISDAIGYAKFYSRSHDAVIRVYNEAGNVIETHEHAGEFKRVDDQDTCGVMCQSNILKQTLLRIIGNGGPITEYGCSPLGLAPS